MANFNELLQNYVDKSYDELVGLARASIAAFSDDLQSIFPDGTDSAQVIAIIISSCIGVDGKFSTLEYKFMCDLLGCGDKFSYEDLKDIVQSHYGAESIALTDSLADVLSDDKKAALISFCLCFLAVDETIERNEVAFVIKLMEA